MVSGRDDRGGTAIEMYVSDPDGLVRDKGVRGTAAGRVLARSIPDIRSVGRMASRRDSNAGGSAAPASSGGADAGEIHIGVAEWLLPVQCTGDGMGARGPTVAVGNKR